MDCKYFQTIRTIIITAYFMKITKFGIGKELRRRGDVEGN